MALEWKSLAAGALAGALGASAVFAAQAGPALPRDRAGMEALVRDYILAHPEIVTQAIEKARANAETASLAGRRADLEKPFPGAVAGNPKGDVTLVEFYDYACGYCRSSVKDVDRLLAEDKGLRVVFRELPILSPNSEIAARAALSAAKAGTFLAFHRAMYAAGKVDAASVAATARATATPPAPPSDPAHDRELDRNIALARGIGVSGTPTFVVGDAILNGAVGYDRLKAAIATARAGRAGRDG